MNTPRFLTDEHVPGSFIASLRSLGYEVLRSKDELDEGSSDFQLLDFARESDRIVVTCDRRFTLIDDEVETDHSGVIYADQAYLQAYPEDAANGIDRIVTTIPIEDTTGSEFYLNNWI